MLTYLWIAIGGAIGSVGRAWLAGAMARATGPAFPWGTILINVLGSFVIGFVGALTAADSRYATGVAVRSFIMVGLCGGFTTFSSFSLQTFDLLRDGRPGPALGNVALSVLLCLASVAAGYAGGAGLAGRATHPQAMSPAEARMEAMLEVPSQPTAENDRIDTNALLD